MSKSPWKKAVQIIGKSSVSLQINMKGFCHQLPRNIALLQPVQFLLKGYISRLYDLWFFPILSFKQTRGGSYHRSYELDKERVSLSPSTASLMGLSQSLTHAFGLTFQSTELTLWNSSGDKFALVIKLWARLSHAQVVCPKFFLKVTYISSHFL